MQAKRICNWMWQRGFCLSFVNHFLYETNSFFLTSHLSLPLSITIFLSFFLSLFLSFFFSPSPSLCLSLSLSHTHTHTEKRQTHVQTDLLKQTNTYTTILFLNHEYECRYSIFSQKDLLQYFSFHSVTKQKND